MTIMYRRPPTTRNPCVKCAAEHKQYDFWCAAANMLCSACFELFVNDKIIWSTYRCLEDSNDVLEVKLIEDWVNGFHR